jgi:nucleoside-diphosphate-sugar epimerase
MLQAHRSGRCKVALVRASDFFGPTVTLSMLGDRFFPSVVAGKKVQLLKDPEMVHDYTYLPDFVRALIAVSNDPESWGRAWHVPNAPAITTKQVIEKSRVLAGFDSVANYSVIPSFMRALLGCFIQPLREVGEMSFLFSADYTVEYGDFLERFPDCQPTPFETSLKATVEWYQNDYVGSDRG